MVLDHVTFREVVVVVNLVFSSWHTLSQYTLSTRLGRGREERKGDSPRRG